MTDISIKPTEELILREIGNQMKSSNDTRTNIFGSDFIRVSNFECDATDQKIHSFEFFWRSQSYETYLIDKLQYSSPLKKEIDYIENLLNIVDTCCSNIEYRFYFNTKNQLKALYVFSFCDPYDENADEDLNVGDCEDIDFNDYLIEIHNFYYEYFIKNMVPEELSKPINLMSEDEIKMLEMYIL